MMQLNKPESYRIQKHTNKNFCMIQAIEFIIFLDDSSSTNKSRNRNCMFVAEGNTFPLVPE
jgi:hypothetical protein